ncbi:MAG: heme exporter protein CcmB [Saprospiraceae bacterium]|nr:heme exporter protein CcmB [Saprospiraceae bacterium]MCB0544044.1 heme exporter protein CcmB [Saprospiraceae bacterium]MCB0574408.1 heme exporter protein CcmB [Saprospiraceae bacterium]MCB9307053.1 heme exporter protein CcmB [Lewinellaceae bacterium]MCB9353972.1 heme exporter protein CcmB [Lewinellaceae bacterium]
MNLRMLWILLRKEFLLEFRQRYAISGIVLYVFSMVFVVYISSIKVQPPVWNILFWLIVLFASINAVVKSFVQESGARQLYYYQLADPAMLLLAKILYNTLLLLVLSVLAFGAYSVVAGNPVKDAGLFALVLLLGSLGFSIAFTFIASIAAKANNSATLMAILSFPVILPVLLTLVRLSQIALRLIQDTSYKRDIVNLLAIDAILITLTFILFPYIWKD